MCQENVTETGESNVEVLCETKCCTNKCHWMLQQLYRGSMLRSEYISMRPTIINAVWNTGLDSMKCLYMETTQVLEFEFQQKQTTAFLELDSTEESDIKRRDLYTLELCSHTMVKNENLKNVTDKHLESNKRQHFFTWSRQNGFLNSGDPEMYQHTSSGANHLLQDHYNAAQKVVTGT